MTGDDLRQAAEDYATELNLLDPTAMFEWLVEVAVESPFWDDRTNLFLMVAERPEDAALVLATEPGGDDYVLVGWVGQWVVDADPVDWEAVLDEAAEDVRTPPSRRRRP